MAEMTNAQVALMAAVEFRNNERVYISDKSVTDSASHFLNWLQKNDS